MIREFIRDEILGMKWLDRLIASLLSLAGLDPEGQAGGSVRFFLYDSVKILVLLAVLSHEIGHLKHKKNLLPCTISR